MILSLHIAIYISFFVFNKFSTGKNATVTDFVTTADELPLAVDGARTTAEREKRISNWTRDRCPESEPHGGGGGGGGGNKSGCADVHRRTTTTTATIHAEHSTGAPHAVPRNANATAGGTRTGTAKPRPRYRNAGNGIAAKTTRRPELAKLTGSLQNATLKHRVAPVRPKPGNRLGAGSSSTRKPPPTPPPPPLPPPPPPPPTPVDGANRTGRAVVTADFETRYPVGLWKEHGLYTDDYARLINAHWFKFPPPDPGSHYALAFLYTVIMVFGCFGNSLVIFMYIKCKSLQTPANVLIMNLAVSDFIMIAKTPIFIYNSYYQGPALGKLGCQIFGFFGGLTGTVSIMTLAAISLDRYYVIVHPLNAAVKTTKQRARVWIGLIWIYGFAFSVVPVLDLGYNRYVPEGYLTSCSFDYLTDVGQEKSFILVFFAAAWCVPFTTISYCYVKILRAVWVTSEMGNSRFGQEEEKRKTEIRLGYVVIGVIVLWFVSWTPYAMVALLGVFDRKEFITPLNSMIPALFCKAASCMDPWIYAITHPRFKNELTKLMSRKKARKLERDYGMKKGWSHSNKSGNGFRNQSSTEDEDVEEVIVQMVNPDDKIRRHGSTSSHKTDETRALETKFPPTRQESLKYMPPSWYKLPRTSSKSSIKSDATKLVASDNATITTTPNK